ncbi:MAG TPA: NADH-quinone oxidoreductase subunit H, partial [Verrucomicrobiae bacterium]
MNIGLFLLLASLSLLAGVGAGFRWPRLWLVLTVGGALTGLGVALSVLAGGGGWDWHSDFLVGGQPLHLRLDGLSALFLVIVAVVGSAGASYAREYWPDAHYPSAAPRSRVWWSAFLLSMG